ncbi:AAA family ATPase, partial [Streptomyces sp. B1866]|uniref:AAA family ATPase n=1 Tax=Streptomyces sp. B1866 TaxID=3075431 RepID=UPI0028926DC4
MTASTRTARQARTGAGSPPRAYAPADPPAPGRPPVRTGARPPGLVGRQAALDALSASLDGLAGDDPVARLVTVTGDPGIGKTAVLGEFARLARARGAVVRTGRVARDGRPAPFGAFADAFADASAEPPAGIRADVFDDISTDVSTEVSADIRAEAFTDALTDIAADVLTDRYAAAGARDDPCGPTHARTAGGCPPVRAECAVPGTALRHARAYLERLAAPCLVLVLDDVHAADPESTGLLAGLLRRPPRAPVLLVLGYRDRQAGPALQAAVSGRSEQVAAEHVHLGPLSARDVDQVLAGAAPPGDAPTAVLRRQLYRDSGGNPGYLAALLAERPAAVRREPARPGQPPRSAAGAALLDELAPLEPGVRAVAEAAAVVGHEFEAHLLTQVLGEPEPAVLAALGELIRRDLVHPVVPGQCFAFRHPVVHRAVYHAAELSRRIGLHARADQALCARGACPAERAPHLGQCVRHGDLAAVGTLDQAAAAVGPADPAAAASWLATALRVLPQSPRHQARRAALLVRLAEARAALGRLRECRELMHEALRLLPARPAADRAAATVLAATAQRLLGDREETGAMLRAELAALDGGHPLPGAALKAELAVGLLHAGDPESCARWAREALAVAERHPGRPLRAACLGLLALAAAVQGRYGPATAHLEGATAVLDAMLDGELARGLETAVWIGWCEVLLDRADDALRHFQRGADFALRTGHRLFTPQLLAGQAYVLGERGSPADARAAAEHAVHLARLSGSPGELAGARALHARLDAALGGPGRAPLPDPAEAAGRPRAAAGGWREALALRLAAEARLLGGDHEGCLALVAEAGGPHLPTADAGSRVAWYELLTRAELAAGRTDHAARWAQLAELAAAPLDRPARTALAELARAQALLIRDPRTALAAARAAAAALDRAGRAVDALRARVV